MTRKLYHADAYRRECASVITQVRERDGRVAVALDETVFYPASGGQPPDHGRLDDGAVVDVIEDDEEVWHVLDADGPLEVGRRVVAAIDWARRFDHMQQHTGQHILSQAFLQTLGAQTVSVHMERTCTLDLAISSLDPAAVIGAERLANTVTAEARPIVIRELDADAAATLGLRRPPKQTGQLRVVEVAGFDRSACGGTHVRTASEAAPIVVKGWERYKGGVRVEFTCGHRALADYHLARGILRDLASRLTTGEDDLSQGVERLQARLRDLERSLDAARLMLIDVEADRLIAGARTVSAHGRAVALVATVVQDRGIDGVRALARAITARGGVAIVGMEAERRVIVARPPSVDLDAAAILREALAVVGGRGGGRQEMAEGAAPASASAATLVEAATAAVAARLASPRA